MRWRRRIPAAFGPLTGGKISDPSVRQDRLEWRSAYATLAILIGILGEIIALFAFSHPNVDWAEKGLLIACDLLIGVGLVIEYFCIIGTIEASAAIKAESVQLVAEANQKAQEAILELAKFRAPRRLTGQQMVRTAEKLKQFSGTEYDVALQSNDPELMEFLYFIEFTLLKAGWKAISWAAPVAAVTTSRGLQAAVGISVTNVVVGMHPEQVSLLRPAAQFLADELMAAGINAMAAPMPWINANATAIHILIGRKL